MAERILPTEPGWYFLRQNDGEIECAEVYRFSDHPGSGLVCTRTGSESEFAVDEPTFTWLGKVSIPPEVK